MKKFKLITSTAIIALALNGYASANNLVLFKPAAADEIATGLGYLQAQELTDGRYFMRVDHAGLRALTIGNTLQMVFPVNGRTYRGVVNNMAVFSNMRRLTGDLFDGQTRQDHGFSMTLSIDEEYVAGNFSLGKDSYTLEAKGSIGWVADVRSEGDWVIRQPAY